LWNQECIFQTGILVYYNCTLWRLMQKSLKCFFIQKHFNTFNFTPSIWLSVSYYMDPTKSKYNKFQIFNINCNLRLIL